HIRRLRAVRSRARAGRPVSESVPADSVRAEPVRAEPVRAEPVRAEPVRSEPVRAESARIQPAPRLLCRLCGRTPSGTTDHPVARAAGAADLRPDRRDTADQHRAPTTRAPAGCARPADSSGRPGCLRWSVLRTESLH